MYVFTTFSEMMSMPNVINMASNTLAKSLTKILVKIGREPSPAGN